MNQLVNFKKSLPITLRRTKIISAGSYLPDEIVKSNHVLEDIKSDSRYGIATTWLSEVMGIEEHRVAPADAVPSDLAIPAAMSAIAKAGIDHEMIDMVIFCGIEGDQQEPATAHNIQKALGLSANYVFDVSNACYGFINGMQIADQFISSGVCQYALVVTGEIPSRVTSEFAKQLKKGVDVKTARDLLGFFSAGDAGGAAVLGGCDYGDECGFKDFTVLVDSSHAEKCFYKHDSSGSVVGQMLMAKMVAYGFRMQKEILPKTFSVTGWEDFDWLLTHQTGKRNFDQIVDLGITPESNMIKTYDKLGNITSATFPVAFEALTQENRLKKGDRIGGCFGGSGLTVGQFGYQY